MAMSGRCWPCSSRRPRGRSRSPSAAIGPPPLGRRQTASFSSACLRPDTDTIRWVTSARSVERTADLGQRGRLVRLDRFGRKADHELRAALRRRTGLVLDLRCEPGRQPRPDAARRGALYRAGSGRGAAGRRPTTFGACSIPAPQGALWRGPITVLVGPDTMSSGEVLAALLRRYAGATVLGERTFGKDYVLRVEPIAQGWRALIPDGRLEVPGQLLAGGLLPEGPIPVELAARLPFAPRLARPGEPGN